MPSRKTHEALTVIAVATNVPALAVGYFIDPLGGLLFFAGTAVTLFPDFTPDLDVSTRRFGVLGEFLGFKTYARLVPHRAGLRAQHWSRLRVWNVFLLSHIPILGTLPRTVMLYLPAILVFLLLNLPFDWLIYSFPFVWAGMSYGDVWHVGPDIAVSDFKEMYKGFWRKRRVHGGRKRYRA